MDDKVLEKKKGLNLMTKILITALIPLILIVVLAGVSIHSVGSNGCKTVTYKYLYNKNGTLVSSECLSRDTYNPHNKIIAVGY